MIDISNEILKFILQANTDSLKTAEYPKEHDDLRMKVSFGMGAKARVPWISFTSFEMSTQNGYFPVFLYYREKNILILSFGVSESYEAAERWSLETTRDKKLISEYINNPPRYGDSHVFKGYEVELKNDGVIFKSEGQEVPVIKLSQDLNEIINIYKKHIDLEIKNESSPISSGLFYMEKQLEDFIIENWESTELGKKYDLIHEDGNLVSQQYRTDIGPIDILAYDKSSRSHVVIELKKNQTSDDTVGQVARYMGWIEEAKKDPNVKGIIIAGKYDKKLFYAMKRVKDVEVFLYEVNFLLREYSKD